MRYVETLPQDTPRQHKNHERIRYLFHLFYLLAARISEVANHTMASLKQQRGKWWWHATGKGQKTQRIPLNDAMLGALMRYRSVYDLSPLPSGDASSTYFASLKQNPSNFAMLG